MLAIVVTAAGKDSSCASFEALNTVVVVNYGDMKQLNIRCWLWYTIGIWPCILKAKKFAESAFQSQTNLRKKCVNLDIEISRQKCVNR